MAPFNSTNNDRDDSIQMNWARVALDNFNSDHGTAFTIEPANVSRETDRGVVEATILAANSDVVGVVGPPTSIVANAVGPIFDAAGLSYVSPSATAAELTDGHLKNFFRVVANDSVQGPSIGQFIASRLRPKTVLVVNDDEIYSIALSESIAKTLKRRGVAVKRIAVTVGSPDVDAVVDAVTDSINVVALPLLEAEDGQKIADALQAAGKRPEIIAADSMFNLESFNSSRAYVSTFAPDVTATVKGASIARLYQQIFGSFAPYGAPAGVAMETVLTAALNSCENGSATRAGVTRTLPNIKLPRTILGIPISFDKNHDVVNGRFLIYKIQANAYYLVK